MERREEERARVGREAYFFGFGTEKMQETASMSNAATSSRLQDGPATGKN